jgi:hypothetical protein
MGRPKTLSANQLKAFASFLETHPGFSPFLVGEDVIICGFQIGGCVLRIDEMERLIGAHSETEAANLPAVRSASDRGPR